MPISSAFNRSLVFDVNDKPQATIFLLAQFLSAAKWHQPQLLTRIFVISIPHNLFGNVDLGFARSVRIALSLRVFIANNLCFFNILYVRRLLTDICSRYFRYAHILQYSQAGCSAFIGCMIAIIASPRSCTEIPLLRFITSLLCRLLFFSSIVRSTVNLQYADSPDAIALLLQLLHRIQRIFSLPLIVCLTTCNIEPD